ncbi:hypothetical protein M951_chr3148 (nucleomorph) [Lotharella oceanica]|uniref:Uncharacterized protein n=1 Tax=Lotharella oceanica TaxID=641309 RepID=A0A060D7X4_9EUKA|nr:hypothetical protein M951_chr3148 [Lotharella oceanica]|mmetsp:Transcript_27700/g.51642  ORF Transcript_27700/g.51642 Transcript_27700/m.51642 type:complete len:107 (+) Transcript_27700:144-464(+)
MTKREFRNFSIELCFFNGGMIISYIITRLQDKLIGFDVKPYQFNRDFLINMCNEASVQIQNLNNKIPLVTEISSNNKCISIDQRWSTQINWKKWKLVRNCSIRRNI